MAIYHGRKRISQITQQKANPRLTFKPPILSAKILFLFPVFVGPHGRPLFSSKQIVLDSQHIPFRTSFAHPKPHYAIYACHFGSGWHHIRKRCQWIRFGDCTKQACIRAKPFEDSGRVCSVHEPHGCKHPLFCPIFGRSIVVPPAHPIQHIWVWHLHHPQGENPLAPHGPSQERFWNHLFV